MSISSSWIHGNALTIESPIMFEFNYDTEKMEEIGRFVLTPSGPGAWVDAERGGEVSWFHLPIPTINANVAVERYKLLHVFLLFWCEHAHIREVHVYDGSDKINEFKGVSLQGNYLVKLKKNTFHFVEPHQVKSGISISFLFTANYAEDLPHRRLLVAAAGADFLKSSTLFSKAISARDHIISRLTR